MKRKYSISLGIGAVLSILYLIIVTVHLYNVYQNQMNAYQGTFQFLMSQLMPHVILAIVGTVLIIVAFFFNIFAVALAAVICFGIAIVLVMGNMYQYAVFCIPSTVCAAIGTYDCYQRKQRGKEEAEEAKYKSSKVQGKTQTHPSYAQRHQEQSNQLRQMRQGGYSPYAQNMSGQGNYAGGYQQPFAQHRSQEFRRQPYQQQMMQQPQDPFAPMVQNNAQQLYGNPYQNDPLFTNPTLNSPYDPLTMNQPNQMINQRNQLFIPNNQQLNPMLSPYQQQPPQNNMGMNNLTYQNQDRTISDGYFDDYGNFHPGNGNKF